LSLPVDSFFIIVSLGAGIVIGALLFSRFIRWLLSTFHDLTMACMVGFMIGALPAVWPFWIGLTVEQIVVTCAWVVAGALIVVFVEKISQPAYVK